MKSLLKNPVVWLVVGIIPVSLAALAVANPTNKAETKPAHPDPRLRTRRYTTPMSLSAMEQLISDIIPTLTTYGQAWKHVPDHAGSSPDSIIIRAEVPVLFFTDDLQVYIRPDQEGAALLVDIWSASRVGKSDLGENRRHIRQLLGALDAAMRE